MGGRPNTGYLQATFAHLLNTKGQVQVTPELRVRGQERWFALGDITDLAENKMAWITRGHVDVAAANIAALLGDERATLKTYQAKTGNPMMALTLGPSGGVTQLPPPLGAVRASWFNRKVKATHMLVPKFRKVFGL